MLALFSKRKSDIDRDSGLSFARYGRSDEKHLFTMLLHGFFGSCPYKAYRIDKIL